MCDDCDPRCTLCTSASHTDCSACTGSFLFVTTCDTCPDKYYGNTANNVCTPCVSPCNFCTTAADCSSCVSRYYLVPSTTTCAPCISHCLTCPDAVTCTTCDTNYIADTNIINSDGKCICVLNMYMYQGNCITTCPSPLYGEPSTRTCTNCPTECSKCNSPIDCTECASGYAPTPVSGQCVCM